MRSHRIASPRASRNFPSLFLGHCGTTRPRYPSSISQRRRAAANLRRVVLNRGVVWPNLPTVSVHSRNELLGAVRAALCMSFLSCGFAINSDRRGGDRVVTLKMEGALPAAYRQPTRRRHEKVAVALLAPFIQAPSRKDILKNDI